MAWDTEQEGCKYNELKDTTFTEIQRHYFLEIQDV